MSLLGNLFNSSPAGASAPLPGYPPGLSDAEINIVFARAIKQLDATTAVHVGSWHMDSASWSADLEAGTISFVNQRGWTITAPVQVIGTRSPGDGTWLWAWDHPSVPPACAAHSLLVKAFGAAQGLEALTTRKIEAGEDQAWELTALALHLSGANGAYRGPAGNAEVFMTFGEITIAKG